MHPRGQHTATATDISTVLMLRDRRRRQTAHLARLASGQILNLDIADKNKASAYDDYLREGKQTDSVMIKPLLKTVSGSGYDLAKALIPNVNSNQPPKPEAPIGTSPAQFRPILREYRLVDIFDLIEFYNRSFDRER